MNALDIIWVAALVGFVASSYTITAMQARQIKRWRRIADQLFTAWLKGAEEGMTCMCDPCLNARKEYEQATDPTSKEKPQ